MDAGDGLDRDVKDLHGCILQLSTWLPRFLGHLSRFESLPNPTDFPRVVASIGREFKFIVADMKSKVQVMKRIEALKQRLQPQLSEPKENGLESLAVNLQLLELEWRRTCLLVRDIHDKIVVAVKRACAQTFLDEANKKKVILGDLYIIEEEEEGEEDKLPGDPSAEMTKTEDSTLTRRHKFHLPVDSKESIDLQLAKISSQLFESSMSVTSMEPCQLSSVGLELRVGELQALKTILEIHHSEITYMLENLGASGSSSNQMVIFTLNDLWEKCGILIKHFEEMEEQYREVGELVTYFEDDMKGSWKFLQELCVNGSQQIEWSDFEQAFEQLEDHQLVLTSLSELSSQLLTLEPTFEGGCIRESMQNLADKYNETKAQLKSHLSAQVEEKGESFSCDVALVSSWAEQALLLLNHHKSKQVIRGSQLVNELAVYQEMLVQVKQNVVQMSAAVNRANISSRTDLCNQVESVDGKLTTISLALSMHETEEVEEEDFCNRPLSGLSSIHFGELDDVIHQLTQEVQFPPFLPLETVDYDTKDDDVVSQLPSQTQDKLNVLEDGIADVSTSIDRLELPSSLDVEGVRSAVDACRTYQRMLDVLHQKITDLTLENHHTKEGGNLEFILFDLSTSLQKANVHLADKLNCLHGKEMEIAKFNRQVVDLMNIVHKAQYLLSNPSLDMQLFVAECTRMGDKMAALNITREEILEHLAGPNGPALLVHSDCTQQQVVLLSEWEQTVKSLERVVNNQAAVIDKFLKMWEEWTDRAKEEVETLKPSGFALSKISAKHGQVQLIKQNSQTIMVCLEGLQSTDQVKNLLDSIGSVHMEASWLEESLGKHLTKLRKYIEEYNDLKSWLADMTMLVLGEQHSVKRQTLCQQIMLKERSMKQLQELTREMKDLDATSTERTRLLVKANDLFDSWDKLCQQCVPAGVVELATKKETLPQEEFSSPSDMLKWLMSVTTKLHPHRQYSSQQQLEDALLDTKAIKEELSGLQENYQNLVKSEGVESESTWIANQQKRLRSQWQEVNEMLAERIEGLDTLHNMWSQFDARKERISIFLKDADKHFDQPVSLSSNSNLLDVDKELRSHHEFCRRVVARESDIQELKMLSTSLLNYHHGNSHTNGLQEVMTTLTESYSRIKSKSQDYILQFEAFSERWGNFFTAYNTLQQCATQLQLRASELKAPPSNMKTITAQKEIVKVILKEDSDRQDILDSAHLALYQLLEKTLSSPLDTSVLCEKVDLLSKKISSIVLLAKAKQNVLEGALFERQQVINQLASQTAWLGHAQSLIRQLHPLGRDLESVEKQHRSMKGFWVEYEEQMEKMDHVLVASAQLISSQAETDEEKEMIELVILQRARLSEMWGVVQEEAEQAKSILDKVYPELVNFQSLCTQVGRLLTSTEMKLASAQPVAQTLPKLRIQAADHEEVEALLDPLEKLLEEVQQSKKTLLKMGFSPSVELDNLVSRFDRRWVEVSRYGHARGVRLNEVLAKFGSSSIPIRDGTLPRGWSKVKRDNTSPLYTVNTDAGHHSQRQHPSLTTLFDSLQSQFSHVQYGQYRTALKLRELQKRLHLNLINTKSAMTILLRHFDITTETVTFTNLVEVLSAMYHQLEKDHGESVKAARCVDMATSWIMETYDKKHEGSVSVISVKTAVLLLCGGKMNEKLKCFFQVFADSRGEVEDVTFLKIFRDAVKIPQSVREDKFFPNKMGPAAVESLFLNCSHFVNLDKWLSWVQSEPRVLAWVTLMHRLAQSEHSHHDTKCCTCRMNPIVGFRYHCLECFSVDLCQDCFWSGRTTRQHRSTHSVQEYCHSSTFSESIKDFFKVIGNKIKRSSAGVSTPPPTPVRSPALGNTQRHYHTTSGGSSDSGDNLSRTSGGNPREEDLDSLIYQLEEQNRDLADQLESLQSDSHYPAPVQISSKLLYLQESRQALEGRIVYLQSQNDKLLSQIGKLRNIVHQRSDIEVVDV